MFGCYCQLLSSELVCVSMAPLMCRRLEQSNRSWPAYILQEHGGAGFVLAGVTLDRCSCTRRLQRGNSVPTSDVYVCAYSCRCATFVCDNVGIAAFDEMHRQSGEQSTSVLQNLHGTGARYLALSPHCPPDPPELVQQIHQCLMVSSTCEQPYAV